jgi:uncharacterized membrane protein
VAFCAGVAGMLSLTTAKSGALIGVLISVTTIPSAAAIAVAAAYRDGDTWTGSVAQLAVNLTMILVAGVATLSIQRRLYTHRRREHLREKSPPPPRGLPVGRSRDAPKREPV